MLEPVWYQGGVEAGLSLQVLGPLAVRVDGIDLGVRGQKKHRLLARLALTPTRSVSVDSLISALWGDEMPRTAKQSLHVHISHLRERLREHDAEHLITTTPNGEYRLGIPTGSLDATLFEALIDDGLLAHRSDNPRHARDVLSDALALWNEPYDSLAEHPGAIAERQRLTALQEAAVDALCDSLLELGEVSSAIPVLRQTLSDDPLRERPYAQLVSAYLQAGELGSAQAVLDHASSVFRDELGIEVSDELRAMLIEPAASRNSDRRARTQPGPTDLELLDPSSSWMVVVEPTADLRPVEANLADRAGAQERRVAWARVGSASASDRWSPLVELSGGDPEVFRPGRTESMRAVHRRLTDALVARFSAGFVLAIDGLDRVSEGVADYLTLELTKPGPSPFTLVGVVHDRDAVAEQLRSAMGNNFVELTLPVRGAEEGLADSLDPVERQVVASMALANRPSPPDLIARACDCDLATAAASIDRLLTRQVLVVEPGGRIDFRDVNAALSAVDSDDETDRQLHLRMADLAAVCEADGSYRLAAEARHRLQALPDGSVDVAIGVGLLAADHFWSAGAYGAVIDLIGSCPVPPSAWPESSEALELTTLWGCSLTRAGRVDEGRSALLDVLDSARRLGASQILAQAVRGLADARSPQVATSEVSLLVVEALDVLGDELSDTRVQLMTDHANSFYLSDPERAEALAAEALAVGARVGGATHARSLTGLIQAKMRPGNAGIRLELAFEAQQLARRSNSVESLVLALTYEAAALFELGELQRAHPPLRYAEALAFDSRVPRFRWWVAAWQALLQFASGDLAGLEDRFRWAFELWPTSDRNDAFECFAAQMTALRLLQGRGPELLSMMEPMIATGDISLLGPIAAAQAQSGNVDATLSTLGKIMEAVETCRDLRLPYALALAAEAAHLVDAEHLAPELIKRIEPLADVHVALNVWGGGGFYWGSLRHALGLARGLSGDSTGAKRELLLAASAHTAAGASGFAERSHACARRL